MEAQHAPGSRLAGLVISTLAVASGAGLLGLARRRIQQRTLFLPDRYPNGVWSPGAYGLPAEDRWFHTPDGEKLHGWWIPSRRSTGAILYCHGNSGSLGHQIGILRRMRRLGLDIFAFDYRGYGRSTGRPSEQGLYLDARAAFDYLCGPLEVRPSQIVLFGHSLGGAVAVDCALDRSAAGLIVQSSFTHLKDAARSVFPGWPLHLATGRRFYSLEKVSRLRLPKLFIHGTEDGTVPAAMSERLFDAALEPKELYLVRRAGHNDVHRHGGLTYLLRLRRFCRRCLKESRANRNRESLAMLATRGPETLAGAPRPAGL